ncbi:MAG TPA: hypothetical protein VN771_04505 [Candidatus Baltobacteraceae bacterium]|nr:hypothetical protein [Candidatus Baltobacteraceae bacterium]
MSRGPAWVSLVVGCLLVLVGLVWIGQGVGLIGGGFMSGNGMWAVIGLVVAVIGGAIVVRAVRVRRAR